MERKGQQPKFPELHTDQFIASAFMDCGPVAYNGMGACGLSWQEIESYCEQQNPSFTGWHRLALREMSLAYAGSLQQSREQIPAPYAEERPSPQELDDKIRAAFAALTAGKRR